MSKESRENVQYKNNMMHSSIIALPDGSHINPIHGTFTAADPDDTPDGGSVYSSMSGDDLKALAEQYKNKPID